eukprot:TRINITY_DN0_c483_g1_i1.p1 TRINITY_DN0_c483_g1~~TRINITY_DN0_c483_g1_i1.p1  ORF type:complete len:189 (+),score=70.78 TRINITY_DN0_c483_g1_i1:17-583(+)
MGLDKIADTLRLREFEKVAPLKRVADKVGLPVHVLLIAAGGLSLVLIVFNYGSNMISSVIGFLYPAYMSFKALESKSSTDKDFREWLTYWVVYSFLVAVDPILSIAFFWLNPFYYLIKVAFYVALFHPKTRGASIIYERYLRDLLKRYENQIDEGLRKINEGIDTTVTQAKPHLANAAANATASQFGK